MWNKIIGQDTVKEKLKMLFKSNKLAHAFLFYGPEGVGKDAAAIELAKLVNCSNPINGEEACDKCESCLKIISFRSENFHFICALPAGRSEQTDSDPMEKLSTTDFENLLEQLRLKSIDPYHRVVLPNANNIRINSIRDIISKIYLTSGKNNFKVFIISEADRMRPEASNALLKILEEPPKNSILILTTSKPDVLPQTVSGRCQKIFFEPLNVEQIKSKLNNLIEEENNNLEVGKEDIELACRLANGSISRAMDMLNFGAKELRNLAISFLVSSLIENGKDTVSIVRKITENNNKDKTRFFLYILNVWFKDLLTVRYSGNGREVSNFDVKDRLLNFSNRYLDTDIYGSILAIEECEKYITQNVHLPLILTNLSFKLNGLIRQE